MVHSQNWFMALTSHKLFRTEQTRCLWMFPPQTVPLITLFVQFWYFLRVGKALNEIAGSGFWFNSSWAWVNWCNLQWGRHKATCAYEILTTLSVLRQHALYWTHAALLLLASSIDSNCHSPEWLLRLRISNPRQQETPHSKVETNTTCLISNLKQSHSITWWKSSPPEPDHCQKW